MMRSLIALLLITATAACSSPGTPVHSAATDAAADAGARPDAPDDTSTATDAGRDASNGPADTPEPSPAEDSVAPPDGTSAADGLSAADAAPPPSGCAPCAEARGGIVDGLSLVHFQQQMSRVGADPERWAPLVWAGAQATGGDKAGLPGTLPAPGWLGVVGAGRAVAGAGHEGAWGGSEDGRADNDAVRTRILRWLRAGGTHIAFSGGHQEWMGADALSPAVTAALAAEGVTFGTLAGPLDATALAAVDVLILGNPWGPIPDAELDAIVDWVSGGGALMVLGLGWSWSGYHDDRAADAYPVNRLGARLGFRSVPGSIHDPAPPAGTPDAPAYAIRPLSEYQPLQVHVLRAAETDVGQVASSAAAQPDALFVIEGAHMGLALPTASWPLLDDPAAALAALDRVYEAELALAGGAHPPFGGDTVWVIPQDAPGAPWWMHSGNPIVYQAAAAEAEIIPRLNAEGHPGWGVAHEQGHNMHSSTCGDLFVSAGTGEVWPNVFGLASYRANGWDWAPQMGAALFAAGHAYHAQATPDFAALQADPFILLGCLDLLGARYGWEGMQRFMTQAAVDHAAGVHAPTDADRVAYLVEKLSAAYEVNFAPLITHWGFPVTDASRAVTSVYPASDIGW